MEEEGLKGAYLRRRELADRLVRARWNLLRNVREKDLWR
jgi:hypothetical protein